MVVPHHMHCTAQIAWCCKFCVASFRSACQCSAFSSLKQAKNLVPDSGGRATKVGEKVVELQRLLPNARVIYCSATGAHAHSGCTPASLVPSNSHR